MSARFIHEFLLSHAETRATLPAVVSDARVVTHRGLRDEADALAVQLRRVGIKPGQTIVVMSEPTIETVALVCACSIVGAVYVPVDASAPRKRLRGIFRDVEATLIVIGATHPPAAWAGRPWATLGPGPTLTTPDGAGPALNEPLTSRHVRRPSDVCYVLFTSGTTGRPKGIVMSHRAVLAFWRSLVDHCNPSGDPGLRVGSFSSLQFDFSLLDWGLGLGSGGSVALVDRALFHQPRRFLATLLDRGITLMSGVPSLWANVIKFEPERLSTLRGSLAGLLFAGEAFPIPWLHTMRSQLPGLRLINCFGHSESIACTFHDLDDPLPEDWRDLPISRTSTAGELLLLTEEGKPITEPGIVGEIAVRSTALFDGYLGHAAATAFCLIADPADPLAPPIFRSGDLGEVSSDGLLRFRGRRDNQVKILGNRVELEEVEAHAMRAVGVQAAVAVKSGEEIWLAVEESQPGGADLVTSVANHLRENLPRYMLPTRLEVVAAIHRNSNGKADRARMLEEMAR